MATKLTERNNLMAAERRNVIQDHLFTYGAVKVADLAKSFGVAENTVREDLDMLAGEGKLVRVHGGAVIGDNAVPSPPYKETRGTHLEEKRLIGQAALQYVPESGSIFVFAGSTNYQLISRLPSYPKLHIYTNSLSIASYIASNNIADVDILGGTIVPDSLASDMSMWNDCEILNRLYWDVAFLGTAGLDINHGLTNLSRSAAQMASRIIERSSKLVVLSDSSKIGHFSHVQICPAESMNVLVTDDGISEESVGKLTELGVEVKIASRGNGR